jgi:hypothetical protein
MVKFEAIQKKFRKKTLIFTLLGANKILGQFGTMIKNGTPSCDSTPIFKMLKGLSNKSSH